MSTDEKLDAILFAIDSFMANNLGGGRALIPSGEITNLALDMRNIITDAIKEEQAIPNLQPK